MNKQIVTIARMKGSGGHYVGQLLAQRLGVPCYDSEILRETARKSGFAEKFIEENEEKKPSSLLYSMATGYSAENQPLQQQLFVFQQNTIRELAEQGSCVFVGRCADYALRQREGVVNCFVHAPLESRILRTCERQPVTPAEARQLIQKTDKARSDYSLHFADLPWNDAQRYHLTVDTSLVGIDGAVDAIMEFLRIVAENESKAAET